MSSSTSHSGIAPALRRAPVVLALFAVVGAAGTGCSDDDTTLGDAGAHTRHHDAGRPDAGRDAAAAAPDAGEPPPFDGSCGGRICPESGLGTPLCCTERGAGMRGHLLENTGRAPGLCGTDVGMFFAALEGICVQLEQPGTIDSECPAQEQLGGGVVMPGCCTDEGYCGSLENVIRFGCFYATGRKGRPCTAGEDADGGL